MYSKDYYDTIDYKPEKIGIEIFQKMSQYMPYMVFITRAADFKLLYANRKVSEFLGFNLDDLHNMDGRIGDMMAEDDIDTLLDTAQKIQYINDDQALKMRVKLKSKEGRIVHLETSISVFKRDENNAPSEYFCVSEDVTDKVLMEARTQELEMITRSAEEAFRYGAWEWFPDSDRVIWSKGIYDIFEKSALDNEFSIEQYMAMIHPDDMDLFNKTISEACRTATPFSVEYRILSSNNQVFYLMEQGKPIKNDKGEIVKFIGTIRDTSDYWETLNNLNKFEATLQEAEKQMHLGTWEWNIAHGKVKWSEGFWDILEYPADKREFDWMPVEMYFKHVPVVDETYSNEKMELIESTNGPVSIDPIEVTLQTYTGKTVYAVTHTRIMEWKDGKPSMAVGSTADVTQMKNIQKNLEAKVAELAKAYEEVEQFSYVASHDLQEPLRKISAFGERLRDKCGATVEPDCAVYIDRIIDGTNRMRLLIENLLSLSRTKRNADYLKKTDLNEVVSEVIVDLENKMSAKSAVINYPELPVIDAIPTQMHQLFLNLLNNSLKFTRPDMDAMIELTYSYLNEKQKNELNLDTQQDYIYIQLRDNGIGFDPMYAESIFSPFKRLHGRSEYEGTGIGLAICKKVVQNHGGTIWADSSPGSGSTFHIILTERQTEATTQ
jgi:PAS domain S-box-containing protein